MDRRVLRCRRGAGDVGPADAWDVAYEPICQHRCGHGYGRQDGLLWALYKWF